MKGLRADGAGANPLVHLGLVEVPSVDPLCWPVMQTLRLARDCGARSRVEGLLATLANGTSGLPANSITSTLLARIQVLGWHVDENGMVHDMFGPFFHFCDFCR